MLDGADVVEQIALDAAELLSPPSRSNGTLPKWWVEDPPDDWWNRYPGA